MNPDSRACGFLYDLRDFREVWIRRAVDRFVFDDAGILCTETTYEVELHDSWLEAYGSSTPGILPLPLVDLNRTPANHVQVHLVGATHQLLHQLTRYEERRITAEGYAYQLWDGSSKRNVKSRQEFVERILSESDKPTDTSGFDPIDQMVIRRLRSTRTIFALLPLNGKNSISSGKTLNRWTRRAERGSDFSLYRLSVTQSAPLKIVRPNIYTALRAWRRRHRKGDFKPSSIYKTWADTNKKTLITADSSGRRPEFFPVTEDLPSKELLKKYKKLVSFPWWVPDTFTVTIPIRSHSETETYHAELVAPDGVYVDRAHMRCLSAKLRPLDNNCPFHFFELEDAELVVSEDEECHMDRVHIYFSEDFLSPSDRNNRLFSAKLDIVFRPTFYNGLRAGMYISTITTAILWFLFIRLGLPAWSGKNGSHLSLGVGNNGVDRSSLASLLLLVLSLSLGLMIRQEEDPVTRLVHSRFRLRLFIVAASSFYVSLIVAVEVAGSSLAINLLVASIVATVFTIPTLLSSAASKYRMWHKQTQKRIRSIVWSILRTSIMKIKDAITCMRLSANHPSHLSS